MNLQFLFSSERLILLESIFTGALILFLMARRDFTYGIYIWLLSMLFFQHQILELKDTVLPHISIYRVLFVFLIIMFTFEVLIRKRRIFHPEGTEYSMFLFCLLVLISMIWTGSIMKEGGWLRMSPFLTGYIFPFSMFFISQNVYDNFDKRERFIKFIILIGFYLGLTAIFEHFDMKTFIWPSYITDPNFGIHFGRARGPFVMAAVNGVVLSFVFIGSLYFLVGSKRGVIWKFYSLILLILIPFAILFTYTRSAWVGLFIGFSVLAICAPIKIKKIVIIVFIALCVAGILVYYFLSDSEIVSFTSQRMTDKSSIYDRLNLYLTYKDIFIDHPIFGIGFEKFREYKSIYFRKAFRHVAAERVDIHDTFAGILAELGLIGFVLIVYIYVSIILRSRRLLISNETEGRNMVLIFWAFMAVYVLNALTIEVRYFPFLNCIFYIFAGIICGWERQCNDRQAKIK